MGLGGGSSGEAGPGCLAYYKVKRGLEQTFPIVLKWPLPAAAQCIACDVGASPGGWTQILAKHCARVLSIDPGLLHPSVLALPNVTYIGKTLQQSNVATVLAAAERGAELKLKFIVCDVNFEPRETASMLCSHVLACLDGMCCGESPCDQQSPSYVVLTLKLMKKPLQRRIDTIVERVWAIFLEASGAHKGCWERRVVHLTANSANERTMILRLH